MLRLGDHGTQREAVVLSSLVGVLGCSDLHSAETRRVGCAISREWLDKLKIALELGDARRVWGKKHAHCSSAELLISSRV